MRYEKKKYNKCCLQSSSFLRHVILLVQYFRLLSQGNYRSPSYYQNETSVENERLSGKFSLHLCK